MLMATYLGRNAVTVMRVQPFRLLFYSTATGVMYRVAAVKRLPVHRHSADYIFWTLGLLQAGWQETFRSSANRLAVDLKLCCQQDNRI